LVHIQVIEGLGLMALEILYIGIFNSTNGSTTNISRNPGNSGLYNVQGDIINIRFKGETSGEEATVYIRSDDGRINAISFRNTIYAKELCP
jgi:hypothetical protein